VRAVSSLARGVLRTPEGARLMARQLEVLADTAKGHPDFPSRRREAAKELRGKAAALLAQAEELDQAGQ
jgi:hypothetical protein